MNYQHTHLLNSVGGVSLCLTVTHSHAPEELSLRDDGRQLLISMTMCGEVLSRQPLIQNDNECAQEVCFHVDVIIN